MDEMIEKHSESTDPFYTVIETGKPIALVKLQ